MPGSIAPACPSSWGGMRPRVGPGRSVGSAGLADRRWTSVRSPSGHRPWLGIPVLGGVADVEVACGARGDQVSRVVSGGCPAVGVVDAVLRVGALVLAGYPVAPSVAVCAAAFACVSDEDFVASSAPLSGASALPCLAHVGFPAFDCCGLLWTAVPQHCRWRVTAVRCRVAPEARPPNTAVARALTNSPQSRNSPQQSPGSPWPCAGRCALRPGRAR